jgi:serine/threonine protein kinase
LSIPNDVHLERLLDRLHDARDEQTEAIREQGAERDWPTRAPEERAALIKTLLSGLAADLSELDRIHSGSRHKLYRARISDASIVLKASSTEPPSEGAMALLCHEYELLRELKLPGIISVIGAASVGNGPALLMEDAGDTNLAALIFSRRLSIADFLNIAVQLADAVARLHGVRIVHRDIHPGNVVWNSESEVATLCDFAIARTLPTLAMEGPNHKQLEGTLPYMSPEQTGRTGRSTDWRADLYSLGATFYEMLTGAPPFAEGDPVALAHAHIARQARPPIRRRVGIRERLAARVTRKVNTSALLK